MKSILLTRGSVALVDDEDFPYLSKWSWTFDEYARRSGYANGQKKTIRMHRVIMNAKEGEVIDHIDGNKLNNQKKNLRFSTINGNCQNRKRIAGKMLPKGVTENKRGVSYMARIRVDRKLIYLGTFRDMDDAHNKYCEAAKIYFGENARFD